MPPIFLRLCFIAVSAYAAVVLHGCGCKESKQKYSDEEPNILLMDPAQGCVAKDIGMGPMPEHDLAPSYSAVGAIQFRNFEGEECCDAMKKVAKIFMVGGKVGASPDKKKDQKKAKNEERLKAKAVETCGSPTSFDVVIEVQGSKIQGDGERVVQQFCSHDFPIKGYTLLGYTAHRKEMGIEGINTEACRNFTTMVNELGAYNNLAIPNETAKVHLEALKAARNEWNNEIPEVFALKFHLTFDKIVTQTAAAGSMVQVPGASAQNLTSVASPLPATGRPHAGSRSAALRRTQVLRAARAPEGGV